jgi:protein SCO1
MVMINTLAQIARPTARRRGQVLLRLMTACVLLCLNGSAQTTESQNQPQTAAHCQQHKNMNMVTQQPGRAETARPAIPDTPVVDQHGKRLNFYTDLVKGKVVAINFIFTTCTTICPPLGATFAKVGELGGERFGRDFQLISISIDPTTDTPQRLKAWSERFNAKPGWTLVTGLKGDIDQLLKALGGFSASIRDHTPAVLIINDTQGVMTRAYGLASPAKLLSVIDAAGKAMTADSMAHGEEDKQ